jgi:Peptidase of plants and bacteria
MIARPLRKTASAILLILACSDPNNGGTGGTGGSTTGGRGGSGQAGTGGSGTAGTGGSAGTGGGSGGGGGTRPPDAGRRDTPGGDRPRGDAPRTEGGSAAGLDQMCTPRVILRLMDMGPGGQTFLEAMGGTPAGVEQTIQAMGRDICRVLYRSAEEVRAANEIELTIRDYAGVAGKSGDLGRIFVSISTRHIQNVKNAGRDVVKEIKGILAHEMTHMYQHDDKPEGNWPGLANYYESDADAVRIRLGFAPDGCRPGNKGGNWDQKSYCSGGWWWLWVDTKHPGFLYQLNQQMKGRNGVPWKPADATSIAGVTLDALWTEYQGAACCNGANSTCCQ